MLDSRQMGYGNRLYMLRESRGETKDTVAKILDVKLDTYTKIEAGSRNVTLEHVVKLAEHFGISCDYILFGINSENANVWRETGLSDRSLNRLKAHRRYNLDPLFASSFFWRIIERISTMTNYTNDPEEAERQWDANCYLVHKLLDKLLNELRWDALDMLSYKDRAKVEKIEDIRENNDEYGFDAETELLKILNV